MPRWVGDNTELPSNSNISMTVAANTAFTSIIWIKKNKRIYTHVFIIQNNFFQYFYYTYEPLFMKLNVMMFHLVLVSDKNQSISDFL